MPMACAESSGRTAQEAEMIETKDAWSSLAWAIAVIGCALAGLAVQADEAPPPCYENWQRSCAALHANITRVCISGQNAVPCGDVIISDEQVEDIRSATGLGNTQPINIPCGSASVQIHFFSCSGGVCNSQGIHQRTCQGRCAVGPGCDNSQVPND